MMARFRYLQNVLKICSISTERFYSPMFG
jgi:hypothetical protein